MSFLYPGFLFGLFAISIPIIIHLFHFRRFRKIYFSNTSFLRSVKQKKQTKNKLKHLIVLILRILALTSLVFAFSQPFIPNKDVGLKRGKTSISIYIDNSLSMESLNRESTLFEYAKEIAGRIIEGYGEHANFQLITNDFSTIHQRYYNKDEVLNLINEVELTPIYRSVTSILERQKSLFRSLKSSNKITYLISDFQKSTSGISKLKQDTSIRTFLIPLTPNNYDNLFIDSAWFESPIIQYNQAMNLRVKIKNLSDKIIEETTINLILNNKQKGISSFTLKENQSKIIDIPFTINQTGWNKAFLQIEDYPMTFDDKYYFRFYVMDKINILCINGNGTNPYLKALFNTDDYFEFSESELDRIDHSTFGNYQLLIINELDKLSSGLISELIEYVDKGGNLTIIPSSKPTISLEDYESILTKFNTNYFQTKLEANLEISNLNFEHPIFEDIFEEIPRNMNLPKVSQYFPKTNSIISVERKLLSLENGHDVLTLLPYNKGNLFLFSIPLNQEWSNLPKHAVFVPIMYKVALYLKNNLSLSYFIGRDNAVELSSSFITPNQAFEFKNEEKSFIPDYEIIRGNLNFFIDEEFDRAGFYDIISRNNSDQEGIIPTLAFNYNRIESNLQTYSEKELEELSAEKGFQLLKGKTRNLTNVIQQLTTDKTLWKLFIWIALGLLLLEVIILRFWKG